MSSDWSDQIFDSLLEEVVQGKRPPDLTARIAEAWRLQNEQANRFDEGHAKANAAESVKPTCEEVGAVPHSNPTEFERFDLLSISGDSGHARASSAARGQAGTGHAKAAGYGWQALIAVAATVVCAACGLQYYRSSLNDPRIASGSGGKATSKPTDVAKETQKPSAQSEQLSLESVPFATVGDSTELSSKQVDLNVPGQAKMPAGEIVAVIDGQLTNLWQSVGVTPSEKLAVRDLVQVLSTTLTGEQLPQELSASIANASDEEAKARVLDAAMNSQVFAKKMADHFVSLWFQGGKLDLKDPQVTQVRNYVAGNINLKKPWNSIVRRVVGSDAILAAHAGNGNHGLAGRLSESFMENSLACARCHAASQPDGQAISQDQYWSFVGLLSGLDSVQTPEGIKAVDKQADQFTSASNMFFERPDKTLEAVKFLLPNGAPWQSIEGSKIPRSALATWIAESDSLDRATVNQVWQMAMGRPLVPSNAVADDVGLQERLELNRLLAVQFRLHGRDIRELVSWILRSDAFSRSTIKLDRDQWLNSTDEQLAKLHLAEATFAAKTTLGQTSKKSLEGAIASVIKWNASKVDRSVLAQPDATANASAAKETKLDIVMPAQGYIVHHGRLSSGQAEFVNKLIASERLTWDQKVDHIVSLAPQLSVSPAVKTMIDDLNKMLGDKKAVLTELMWIVQNANAN